MGREKSRHEASSILPTMGGHLKVKKSCTTNDFYVTFR